MISALTNHLWQSTLFAIAAGLLATLFRRNPAKVRYWVWFGASVKFLLPFSMLMSLGGALEWRQPVRAAAAPSAVSIAIVQVAEPFSPPPTLPAASRPPTDSSAAAWFGLWMCGLVAVAWLRARNWRRVRAALRASRPIDLPVAVEVRTSPGLLEPGVVGVFRPVLLLPEGIGDHLTRRQLEAVLAHELSHVRRRDNLTAAIHIVAEAIFWFHPLVWWIGARLVEERERACDEAVLAQGNEPRDYAEAILNVCKLYVESPLACVAGVTSADLKRRVQDILAGRIAGELNSTRKAVLALTAAAVVILPVVVGMMKAPPLRAQSAAPKFEVAAIKPCKPGDLGGGGGGRKGGSGPNPSPARLSTGCDTVADLIQSAYISYANGILSRDPSNPPLTGGPSWIQSERYQITAKAEGSPGQGMMRGPMMRRLLEDRFGVKVHREAKEVPVYALTVARGGPRLAPFQEGSCLPIPFGQVPRPRPENACKDLVGRRIGGNLTLEGPGVNLGDFCKMLYFIVDRPVIDKTGIEGRFDFHLEFAVEQTTPIFQIGGAPVLPPPESMPEPTAPSIYTVLQKELGLKLEPSKGPRDYLVIDRVERPTGNF